MSVEYRIFEESGRPFEFLTCFKRWNNWRKFLYWEKSGDFLGFCVLSRFFKLCKPRFFLSQDIFQPFDFQLKDFYAFVTCFWDFNKKIIEN